MRKLTLGFISTLVFLLLPLNAYANTERHLKHTSTHNILPKKQDLSDAALTSKVKAKLLADSGTSGMDIKVRTDSNTVTLTGKVKNEAEKNLAESIAANTQGVKGVNNQLEVFP